MMNEQIHPLQNCFKIIKFTIIFSCNQNVFVNIWLELNASNFSVPLCTASLNTVYTDKLVHCNFEVWAIRDKWKSSYEGSNVRITVQHQTALMIILHGPVKFIVTEIAIFFVVSQEICLFNFHEGGPCYLQTCCIPYKVSLVWLSNKSFHVIFLFIQFWFN